MRTTEVDLKHLTSGEIARLLQHYDTVLNAMLDANNELIRRLTEVEGTTPAHVDVLNEWSMVTNTLQEVSSETIDRMIWQLH